MLDQRQRRWADVVQMLYKCFGFTGKSNSPIKRRPSILTLTTPKYFGINHGDQRFFSIWNHHKCHSSLFQLHLNTYVIGLPSLDIFYSFSVGIRVERVNTRSFWNIHKLLTFTTYVPIILWNSLAMTSNVFTERTSTMKYGVGGLI